MGRSAGMRFLLVGILVVVMTLPLALISDVVKARSGYSKQTIRSLSAEWGGAQLFSGPQMVIPVTEEVVLDKKRKVLDPKTGQALRDSDDNIIYEYFKETVIETRAPIYLYPDTFDLQLSAQAQERRRGIFAVPVYSADIDARFDMPVDGVAGVLQGRETVLWDQAELRFFVGQNRALRGKAVFIVEGQEIALDPLSEGQNGVFAKVGDPRAFKTYHLALKVNGAERLDATAVGRTSRITIRSDWPHPSFGGSYLPDHSKVSDAGFEAEWSIPHLARNLPQISRSNPDPEARKKATLGVRFLTPNDFYQKAWRASEYGVIFIALTFLSILLIERGAKTPTHPVQYLMVGVAQSIFILLMLSYSEQVGFTAAYFGAAGATIALLVLFGAIALKLGARVLALGGVLILVYGVLYLILQSEDLALLSGSTLAFVALAVTMVMTRNEVWAGPPREPGSKAWWQR